MLVCHIFFNLKSERSFFDHEQIKEVLTYLIKFAGEILQMNIEKKMNIVSETLRLLSQMVACVYTQSHSPHEKINGTNAIEFVKEALVLTKDVRPSINIDALFCLTNILNIEKLALDPVLHNMETVNNALIIYFAYNSQVDLDECIITFLYTISQYRQYQEFMKDKGKVLFFLL